MKRTPLPCQKHHIRDEIAMHTIHKNPVPDFAALLQPAVHHQSAEAVLNDPDLEQSEKRVILSSWASDLYAVESCPWLRDVPGIKRTLRLADILAALRSLDDDDPPPRGGAAMRLARRQRVRAATRHAGTPTRGSVRMKASVSYVGRPAHA
jgi:hypothetical protein